MKKTATTIALMTLVLIGTTLAQPPRRVAGSTAVGRGTGVGVKNRQPMNLHKRIDKATPLTQAEDGSGTDNANWQRGRRPNAVGNPFGLGGTVTAGAKNQQGYNLGDTATHEVGHKGKRRRGAIGEGASDVNAIAKERTETVDNNEFKSQQTSNPNASVNPAGSSGARKPPVKPQIQMDIELIAPVKEAGAGKTGTLVENQTIDGKRK